MTSPVSSRLSPDGGAVIIIDQTLLPGEVKYLTLETAGEMYEAIYTLRIRGAPALGVFAGYAMAALCKKSGLSGAKLTDFAAKTAEYLSSSRPTAVNLSRMAYRMAEKAKSLEALPAARAAEALRLEAEAIFTEDAETCRAIGENGLTLIKDGFTVMTYCNAGPLATSKYGTALSPLMLGLERGMHFRAYCSETRPLLQGARLTAWELYNAGAEVNVVCDNMAASLMSQGLIDAVFVGCDRVAKNGDAANKIGTHGLAIIAKRFGVPFYVFCPSTTVDLKCKTGGDIVIENRPGEEIGSLYFEKPVTPRGVGFFNPSFDVTPAELISAIVTEKGVFRYPYDMERILDK